MNQIEWCQVRLDISRDPSYLEIQVTRRSGAGKFPELPGKRSKLPGDPVLGNLPGEIQVTQRSTRRSGAGKFTLEKFDCFKT